MFRLSNAGVSAMVVAVTAFVASGCARTPQTAHHAPPARSETGASVVRPRLAGALPCFDGLRSYRFSGQLSLDAGRERGQLGSLANLLRDVRFDGAVRTPDASTVRVSFPGGGSDDLESIKAGGKQYQRAGRGRWEPAGGGGPFLTALNGLDPQRLCAQTLGTIDASRARPARESLNGVSTLHYRFGPEDLARSPGLFGQERQATEGQAASATLEVWTAEKGGYPLRIVVHNTNGAGPDAGSFAVTIDVRDVNDAAIRVRAPL